HFINWQQDPQGNYLARLVFPEPTKEFSVEVDLVAEMAIYNPFDFFLEPSAENSPFLYEAALARELRPFLETEPAGRGLSTFLANVPRSQTSTINFLVALNQRLHDAIGYVIRMEPGIQSCEQTLKLGTGSCRDSAWLLAQVLRHSGIAARFVSGYLIQLKADNTAAGGASADFTDLHAWAEAYLPGAGWIGLDPTSGLFAGEGHIPLACTPDPTSAAPISGMIEPCKTEFHHEMSVRRIFESPRVTKPYSDSQWREIDALGDLVDADLNSKDVRLTMGGEPTFVATDEAEATEWKTEVAGPLKRRRATQLLSKLRDRFAPHSLLHFGQGKWYPGEPLPRWAFGCYWRKDGVPVWEDASLLADANQDYGYTVEHARKFLDVLTRRLQVSASFIIDVYEDVLYFLWKEQRLPVNVSALNSKLEDAGERRRLARVFEQGLGKQVGCVLPLRRIPTRAGVPRWTSQPWFLVSERMFAIAGDSALGYRLPLESLPWTKPEDVHYTYDPDPFAKREELATKPEHRPDLFTAPPAIDNPEPPEDKAKPPEEEESAAWVARPALCIEPRDGKLFVFMPPVEYLADYLDLVTAIEDTAK
ncbi:MAG TPA: transglutaminase family protein, partial [Terriglobia bacterium]